MTCTACGEKPENTAKDFTKAVVEINNPEQIVMLRKLLIPASMGDDEAFPPVVGKYRNLILAYEASENVYIYSSDGIPTKVTGDLESIRRMVRDEELARRAADDVLQQEIEDIKNAPDVVDIVGTYADLMAYDTSDLGDKDVIRVLVDETHDSQSTYYRWSASSSTWTYIGAVGPYYTKDQTDALLAEKQDTLTFDSTPTAESTNPVTSEGIKSYVDEAAITFKPFPDSVVTDGTTQQLLNSVMALDPPVGMAYLGTVTLSDMPASLIQEEVEVYIYSDYVAYAIMRSTDVSPYAWWCSSYNYQGWLPMDNDTTYTAGANIQISNQNVISATDTTYSAGTNIQISPQNVISATDTTYSDFSGATSGAAGTAGLVPAPAAGDETKFLSGNGLWTPVSQYSLPIASANDLGGVKVGTNLSIDSSTGVLSATDTTYSNFTGTDGTAAGAAGLVPAPATTDAGKFLKADGTWDTAGGGGGTEIELIDLSPTSVSGNIVNVTSSKTVAETLALATSGKTIIYRIYASQTLGDLAPGYHYLPATWVSSTRAWASSTLDGDEFDFIQDSSDGYNGTIEVIQQNAQNTFTTNEWNALWA